MLGLKWNFFFFDVSGRKKKWKNIGLSHILYGLNQKWAEVRSLQLWYRNFIYHQKQKELLHAEIRTGLTAPFPCPAFVRVFQGLGAVIYSITLPKPWHSMWIMMGPGHRAFFSFDLHLFTVRLKSVLAPSTAVMAVMMLIKEAIKAVFIGRLDIYIKIIDIF